MRGKYLVVLFENRADPIMSGREELGYAKVYCSLEDGLDVEQSRYSLEASWEGTPIETMTFEGLREAGGKDMPSTSVFLEGYPGLQVPTGYGTTGSRRYSVSDFLSQRHGGRNQSG